MDTHKKICCTFTNVLPLSNEQGKKGYNLTKNGDLSDNISNKKVIYNAIVDTISINDSIKELIPYLNHDSNVIILGEKKTELNHMVSSSMVNHVKDSFSRTKKNFAFNTDSIVLFDIDKKEKEIKAFNDRVPDELKINTLPNSNDIIKRLLSVFKTDMVSNHSSSSFIKNDLKDQFITEDNGLHVYMIAKTAAIHENKEQFRDFMDYHFKDYLYMIESKSGIFLERNLFCDFAVVHQPTKLDFTSKPYFGYGLSSDKPNPLFHNSEHRIFEKLPCLTTSQKQELRQRREAIRKAFIESSTQQNHIGNDKVKKTIERKKNTFKPALENDVTGQKAWLQNSEKQFWPDDTLLTRQSDNKQYTARYVLENPNIFKHKESFLSLYANEPKYSNSYCLVLSRKQNCFFEYAHTGGTKIVFKKDDTLFWKTTTTNDKTVDWDNVLESKEKFLLVDFPMGTGKTTGLQNAIAKQRAVITKDLQTYHQFKHKIPNVLVVAPFQSTLSSWIRRGAYDYRELKNEVDDIDYVFEKHRYLATCLNSVTHDAIKKQAKLMRNFTLILDESEELIVTLLSHNENFLKNSERVRILNELKNVINRADRVIMLQHGITSQITGEFLADLGIKQDDIRKFNTTVKPYSDKALSIYHDKEYKDFLNILDQHVDKKCYIPISIRENAKKTHIYLTQKYPDKAWLLITKDTINQEKVKRYLFNPTEESKLYQGIIASPVLGYGLSMENHEYVNTIAYMKEFNNYKGSSFVQLVSRNRCSQSIYLVCDKQKLYTQVFDYNEAFQTFQKTYGFYKFVRRELNMELMNDSGFTDAEIKSFEHLSLLLENMLSEYIGHGRTYDNVINGLLELGCSQKQPENDMLTHDNGLINTLDKTFIDSEIQAMIKARKYTGNHALKTAIETLTCTQLIRNTKELNMHFYDEFVRQHKLKTFRTLAEAFFDHHMLKKVYIFYDDMWFGTSDADIRKKTLYIRNGILKRIMPLLGITQNADGTLTAIEGYQFDIKELCKSKALDSFVRRQAKIAGTLINKCGFGKLFVNGHVTIKPQNILKALHNLGIRFNKKTTQKKKVKITCIYGLTELLSGYNNAVKTSSNTNNAIFELYKLPIYHQNNI